MKPEDQALRVTYVTLQATSEGQAAHAHVHEIIRGLRSRNVRVRLAEVRYISEPGYLGRVGQALRAQLLALRTIVWADVFYVRMHPLALPIVLLAWISRRPIVLEVNGPYTDAYASYPALRRISWLLERTGAIQLKAATAVISVTEGLSRWVGHQTRSRRYVVTNGANIAVFHPQASLQGPLHHDLPPRYVVFFGSLSRWQGIDVMLNAIADPNWPDDLWLVIVGDGVMRDEVISAADRGDLPLIYLGHTDYALVPGIAARSVGSLIVKYGPFDEGGLMPLKLFESLAVGIPVIVTDYSGIGDLVRDIDAGYVIPRNNPTALVAAVSELNRRGGDWLRLSAWVRDNASWDARAAQTLKVLESVVECTTPSSARSGP